MKKLLVVILSLLFVVSITGCAKTPSPQKLISETIGLSDFQSELLQDALKKNGVKSKITNIESVSIDSYELTCGKEVYTLLLTEDGIVNKIITPESELLFLNIESLPKPEANTLEALDYILSKAKEDAKSTNSKDARLAYNYITDIGSKNIADLFVDNSTMEKCIYYGNLLQMKYLSENEVLSTFGSSIVELIQGVYLGTEKLQDKTLQDRANYVGGTWLEASKQVF